MTITVTQDCINEGLAARCTLCPVALAIKKQTGCGYVWVGGYSAYIDHGKSIDLPLKARKFIKDFDYGKVRRPFSFELDIP